MPTVESFVPPKKRFLDRALLVAIVTLLVIHSLVHYAAMHANEALGAAVVFFITAVLGGILGAAVMARIIALAVLSVIGPSRQRPLPLVMGLALLSSHSWFVMPAVAYTVDQVRFRIAEGFYRSEVEKSDTSPKFVVFDWGSSGFAGLNVTYLLVFDQDEGMARGLADPVDMPAPNERTKCEISSFPLGRHFHSVTVSCEPS